MASIPHLQEGLCYLEVLVKDKNENCDMIVQE